MTTPSASADEAAAAAAGRWTVAIFALVGMGIALAFFAFRTPTYESEALVAVSNPAGAISDEVDVVLSSTVTNAAASVLGFQPEINVTAAEVASLLTITATADEAQKAADAANTVAATYVQARVGAATSIAQQAVPSDSASGIGPLLYAAIGSLLGAIVGLVVSFFQRLRRPAPVDLPPTVRVVPPDVHSPAQQAAYLDDSSVARPVVTTHPAPPTESTNPMEPPHAKLEVAEMASSFTDAAQQRATQAAPAPAPVHPDPVAPAPAPVYPDPVAPDGADAIFDGSWLESAEEPVADTDGSAAFTELDRRALESRYETALYEMVLTHKEEIARSDGEHERIVSLLRAEVADLHKQVRMRDVRLKNRSGTDQNRVGDLEAQTEALELELASLRQTLEAERIAHSKRLTEEQGIADRALDNARRQYREELSKHVHTHRQSIADHRAGLDAELADDRASHAAALESQHADYERQLETERKRTEAKSASLQDRHQQERIDTAAAHRLELERQAQQHKDTIAELRLVGNTSDERLGELEKENRLLRAEISTQQKQARHDETESASLVQRLSDEIAIMRGELTSERERNAALRSDVLRRSAEGHQAIDRAVEERTAQLAELEASVARQREYADKRVRETSAAAEEQARQAVVRESDLTATISRLKRELAEATKASTES